MMRGKRRMALAVGDSATEKEVLDCVSSERLLRQPWWERWQLQWLPAATTSVAAAAAIAAAQQAFNNLF